MSETANIQENVTEGIKQMISRAHSLSTQLKRAELYKKNNGRDFIREIIVIGYCTMYFSHMSASDLEQILENTLEYFKTGLYDTDKTSIHVGVDGTSFDVRAWVYTPDTHNDAGEWYHIYTFDNFFDAHKCITMLKEIEGELKRLN
jgi:hypothetical protein